MRANGIHGTPCEGAAWWHHDADLHTHYADLSCDWPCCLPCHWPVRWSAFQRGAHMCHVYYTSRLRGSRGDARVCLGLHRHCALNACNSLYDFLIAAFPAPSRADMTRLWRARCCVMGGSDRRYVLCWGRKWHATCPAWTLRQPRVVHYSHTGNSSAHCITSFADSSGRY